jgi:glycogen debranching enzyme
MSTARDANRFFAQKDGDTFIVADAFGDIGGGGDGLFSDDTRLLSTFQLSFNGVKPSLLSAAISRDNVFFHSNMTNRPLPELGGKATPQGVIHLERSRFIWQRRLYERITCANFGTTPVSLPLTLSFAADFFDMFEVRGATRPERGLLEPVDIDGHRVRFSYVGLDGVRRSIVLAFGGFHCELAADQARFEIDLAAAERREIYIEIGTEDAATEPGIERFRAAAARARYTMRARRRRGASLRSSGRLFNEWIERSRADLALLTSELDTGPYPYAGIPWFSVPFGRDAIVTALQTLWLDAGLARGVLRFLAQNQAREVSRFQDAAPGKIMHETRKGEMTSMGELPFGRYYGGVDTTPLFVMLAGAYADHTGDLSLVDELWPALNAACAWIEDVASGNPDGFLTYARAAETGLSNQGWKDSEDSIFHTSGEFPQGPVALVEVQGYVFAAFRSMALLAARRGETGAAQRWGNAAERLRAAVELRFWMEEEGFYGVAIDGAGELCRVRCSNAGHLLYTGLPTVERGQRVAHTLLSNIFDCGWGLRTLAPGQARFNPMSYHNGSVWPHDTGICTAGLARYSERDGVVRLTNQMFEAAVHFGMQLPELFCGFRRSAGEPPVAYPVACLPQAWAAGSLFMMLQACLGLRIDGWSREVRIVRPRLPIGIDHLALRRLAVGAETIDLGFHRVGSDVVVVPSTIRRCSSAVVVEL